jgi:RHS repeat-associated protein
MAAKTAVHSNAFNFLSFVQSGVDPRTGQYTVSLALPELKTNDLSGPIVPLSLSFNPLNTHNSGFGRGWELRLSQYDAERQILSLASGETFLVTSRDGKRLLMEEQKLTSFFFYEDEAGLFRVVHKSGSIEMLRLDGSLALPETVYSAEGHRVDLTYLPFGSGERRLHTVSDAAGPLLEVNLTARGVELLFKPDGAPEGPLARFELILENNGAGDEVSALILPTAEQAAWRFGYATAGELRCITTVQTPLGALETIVYAGVGHGFPGNAHEALPRVSTHRIDPGFAQPVMEVRYRYDNDDLPGSSNNFLGNNSSINWDNGGRDNLYQVNERYLYGTTQSHYSGGLEVRKIERTFNRFHLLTDEKTTQGNAVHRVTTTYYAEDDKPFSSQVAQCQLARRVDTRWSLKDAPGQSRLETVSTAYDIHGNLTEQVLANKVKENYSYFPVGGIAGECPADPAGFVRTLREKTVTPAPDHQPGAPVLRTRHRYALMPPVTGTVDSKSDAWLVLSDETLYQVTGTDEQALQHSAYTTFNDPHDPLLHGRRQRQAVTLNGQTTTTDYAYQKLNSTFVGETVLQTTETLTGFDHGVDGKHTQKTVTLEHSLLHGQPLLTRDDNDVQIRYTYDALQRVTSETVAPDTPYTASRTYRYVLSNAPGQQASQEATDVKGVQTCTLFDGLNRVIKEQRQDKDNMTGARAEEFRDTYFATYNELGDLAEEIERDWCSADSADDLVLLSQYRYDDWGEQRSMTRPDGVEEHEVSDPITQTVTTWIEGMGKTVTKNNLFEKPDSVNRYKLGDDPTDPRVEPISEHLYRYDGLGRTEQETDALLKTTKYVYDAFDRMVENTLPDNAVVERRYALHSTEDLPVWIGVNDIELGQQAFDGLDRMIESITGGRVTRYRFNPGQTQPYKVIRPSLEEVDYQYLPALGEDPLTRTTHTGIAATYEYDEKSARLKWTEENGIKLLREYHTTGEIKSETREQPGQTPLRMDYHYSQQARLLKYTDVLEQDQTYDYDKSSGQLKSTTLGTTTASFFYNTLGLTERIETIDGAQRLEVKLTYDDQGREVLREFDFGAGQTQQLSQVYNLVDGLVQRTLLENGSVLLRDETYGYDIRGRLEEYNCSGTQQPLDPYNRPIEMQYFIFDELDNLQLVQTWSPDTEDSPGGMNVAEYYYDPDKDPTQLIKVVSQFENEPQQIVDLDYNADGNLLHDEVGRSLGYDVFGRLISVSGLAGETPSSYRFDSLDKLASQDIGGDEQQRFYQGDNLVNLRGTSNTSTFVSANGVVLAEHKEGADPKSMLLASDDKNTVLREVGQDFANDLGYSPYGYRSDELPVSGQLGYNGEPWETQTGWYLLGKGYRTFNPQLMRFHSPDSWSPFGEGGLNNYAYCLGNPIKYTDPTGHGVAGFFARLFGKGTKNNRLARELAQDAIKNTVNRSDDVFSTTYRLNGPVAQEHAGLVALHREELGFIGTYRANNSWLMDVGLGKEFAKPKRVRKIIQTNKKYRQWYLQEKEKLMDQKYSFREVEFEVTPKIEAPLPRNTKPKERDISRQARIRILK